MWKIHPNTTTSAGIRHNEMHSKLLKSTGARGRVRKSERVGLTD
jgi:hypothetical protein